MQQHQQKVWYPVGIGLAVALASTFMGCGFRSPAGGLNTPEGVEQVLNTAPYISPTTSSRSTVYEAAGRLRVQHGSGCAHASRALSGDGTSLGFRIHDMAAVPLDYGDAGTVILNGWKLQYADGDHHVTGLGSAIYNVTEVRNSDQFELHWDAGGVLSDENGDDAYEWCYYYTVVFWKRSSSAFDAVAFNHAGTFVQPTDSDVGNGTAVRDLPGAWTDAYGPRAVVPRGFGLTWVDTDHHVLQAGFDLGTPVSTGNTLTWTAQTLLKDDATLHAYHGAALVSVLSSRSVQQWQPATVSSWSDTLNRWLPYINNARLTPLAPEGFGCVGGDSNTMRTQFSVDNVPFDYAVSVLHSWQLQYPCGDHHVKKIGVWLSEFSYVKAPGTATGTLLYTIESNLADDAFFGANGGEASYNVSILGLNALSASPPPMSPPPPPPPTPPTPPPPSCKNPRAPSCEAP
jgi:hypothetical protein